MTAAEVLPCWLDQARARLAARGIQISGVASAQAFPGWLSGARTVVVFASGGPALWEAFLAAVRERPARFTRTLHPLDAFVEACRREADPEPPPTRRWVLCGATERRQPDFRTLALEAGLGHRSRLGLLLHPTYGPWLGLRLACFTTEPLPIDGPRDPRAAPCEGCAAPCTPACPGGAVSERGWDVHRCARFHLESERCRGRCDARAACGVGTDHRYAPLERLYHDDRRRGRAAVARALGIRSGLPGVVTGAASLVRRLGPGWSAWRHRR